MTRGRRVKYEKKEGEGMEYELREWRLSDAADLDGGYHRRGIGRRLFEAMRRDYEKQK